MPCSMRSAILLILLVLWASARPVPAANAAPSMWETLKEGGVVVLMRHARAPGVGDPPDFDLDDPATQRRLSDEGRAQAQAIGDLMRERSVTVEAVYHSRWDRCRETAALLGLTAPEPLPLLDSFFRTPERGPEQTWRLREFIASLDPAGVILMVTHQVNITALTDIFPAEGEMIVVRPEADGLSLVGRLTAGP